MAFGLIRRRRESIYSLVAAIVGFYGSCMVINSWRIGVHRFGRIIIVVEISITFIVIAILAIIIIHHNTITPNA